MFTYSVFWILPHDSGEHLLKIIGRLELKCLQNTQIASALKININVEDLLNTNTHTHVSAQSERKKLN
jgi:hypothetical protein